MNDHLPCSGWSEDSTKEESGLRKGSPRSFLVAHDSDRSGRDRVLHPEVSCWLTGPKGLVRWLYGRYLRLVERDLEERSRSARVGTITRVMIFVWLGTVASQILECVSLVARNKKVKKSSTIEAANKRVNEKSVALSGTERYGTD